MCKKFKLGFFCFKCSNLLIQIKDSKSDAAKCLCRARSYETSINFLKCHRKCKLDIIRLLVSHCAIPRSIQMLHYLWRVNFSLEEGLQNLEFKLWSRKFGRLLFIYIWPSTDSNIGSLIRQS